LSDEDKQGRDLVVHWMRELGLSVQVDRIGNVVGTRPGLTDEPAVMTGSHIKLHEHSVLKFRRRCSPAPTR
jgi:N-carbamoyl-L-amino-acid hydrolase